MTASRPRATSAAPIPAAVDRPVVRQRARPATHRRGVMVGPSVITALEALWSNRMRSLLTVLGVIVGVSAVIAVVTLTQGTSAVLNARVASLGTNVLTVLPGSTSSGGVRGGAGTAQSLTQADADALVTLSHVTGVSPVISASEQIISGAQNWNTRVQGVYPAEQGIGSWNMAQGSWFSQSDETNATAVAAIGQTVVQNLFTPAGETGLGQQILINGQAYRVVGILKTKGTSGFSNQDDVIYIPFSTARTRINSSPYVNQIAVKVDSADNVNSVQTAATTLLEERHKLPTDGSADNFTVRSPTQFVQTAQASAQNLSFLLIGVAAISLIVGGIGIMNIMLVSVTERTREIGIRMAVGARRSDIRNQFLIEALTLSVAGGILGVLIGLLGGLALTNSYQLPYVISATTIALAVGVSAVVGVLFGLYPATRAARLDPIVALRSE